MTQGKRIVIGFLIAYLIPCLGAATGVTLPGNHSVKGFDVSLAFFSNRRVRAVGSNGLG